MCYSEALRNERHCRLRGEKGSGCGRDGFTLIELLVVVSVIAVLLAILLPSLGAVKERARRSVCRGNIRQFIIGLSVYANGDDSWLPSGQSDSGEDEHTPVLSTSIRQEMVKIVGDDKILSCPWLREPFDNPDGWYYNGYGYIIGYNYLGGHLGTPWELFEAAETEWKSPQLATDRSNVPIVTELNAWTKGERWTFAPHGRRGPILESGSKSNVNSGGVPSEEIGAVGGNLGYLDGSVSWKRIEDMKVYRGSRWHYDNGCFTAW